jgi:manganese/zinc/iron transport system permease protein
VIWGLLKNRHSSRKADRLDLLRAIYETLERDGPTRRSSMGDNIYAVISSRQLEPYRTWPAERLERTLKRAVSENLLTVIGPGEFGLTDAAWAEAQRVARNHRLWELYLIHHADVAPASVDRNADRIEHVLGPELIHELELVLARETPAIPRSPHQTTLSHG